MIKDSFLKEGTSNRDPKNTGQKQQTRKLLRANGNVQRSRHETARGILELRGPSSGVKACVGLRSRQTGR